MTSVDAWAAMSAAVAATAVAIRARMLSPRQSAWTGAPAPVWLGLMLLALALAMAAVSLWYGAHATPREAAVYTVLAAVSVAMLWNLNRHGRRREVARRERLEEIQLAMDASGPPARYPFERRQGERRP